MCECARYNTSKKKKKEYAKTQLCMIGNFGFVLYVYVKIETKLVYDIWHTYLQRYHGDSRDFYVMFQFIAKYQQYRDALALSFVFKLCLCVCCDVWNS